MISWILARAWPIVAVLGASLLAALGVQTWRLHSLEATYALAQASWQKERADSLAAALKQSQEFQAEKQAHDTALAKAQNAADTKVAQAHADAATAAAADQRLLSRYRTALAASRATPADNPASGVSPSASSDGVLADVFGSVVSEARRYAAIADDAITAGEQCESSYPVSIDYALKGSLTPR